MMSIVSGFQTVKNGIVSIADTSSHHVHLLLQEQSISLFFLFQNALKLVQTVRPFPSVVPSIEAISAAIEVIEVKEAVQDVIDKSRKICTRNFGEIDKEAFREADSVDYGIDVLKTSSGLAQNLSISTAWLMRVNVVAKNIFEKMVPVAVPIGLGCSLFQDVKQIYTDPYLRHRPASWMGLAMTISSIVLYIFLQQYALLGAAMNCAMSIIGIVHFYVNRNTTPALEVADIRMLTIATDLSEQPSLIMIKDVKMASARMHAVLLRIQTKVDELCTYCHEMGQVTEAINAVPSEHREAVLQTHLKSLQMITRSLPSFSSLPNNVKEHLQKKIEKVRDKVDTVHTMSYNDVETAFQQNLSSMETSLRKLQDISDDLHKKIGKIHATYSKLQKAVIDFVAHVHERQVVQEECTLVQTYANKIHQRIIAL